MERVRHLLLGGPASAALLVLMLAGCLFMWVGVPLVWLWVGSQLQGSVELGTALMVMMVGALGTILATAPLLVGLNRRYVELRAARGQPVGESSPLEVILVVSAVLAIIACAIWFFGFSGSSPLPLNLGY